MNSFASLPYPDPLGRYKWKMYLSELVGTFFFFYILICVAVAVDRHTDSSPLLVNAFAAGLTITALIYALGPVSGTHVNPAVTLAAVLARQLTPLEGLGYAVAQLVGGILGGLSVMGTFTNARNEHMGLLGAFELAPGISWGQAFFCEVLLTFLLIFVIFCVVLNPHPTVLDMQKNDHIAPLFAPIAVGFTVTANIITGGFVSGACMNPTRALVSMLLSNHWDHAYVYLIAPFIGGAFASFFQRLLFGKNPWI